MKKISILFVLLNFVYFTVQSQESFSDLILKAKELKKDSLQQLEALHLYEKAFDKYPDSISDMNLYNASLLANDLKEFDAGFKFLKPLSELIEDEEGYPGWDYIVGEYANEDYKNLQAHPRWKEFEENALIRKKEFFNALKKNEQEFFDTEAINIPKGLNQEKLYNHLKEFNPFKKKLKQNYSISFCINDTLKTSYFVHLPENYNPQKKYPVLLFLHGAVRHTSFSDFQTKSNLKYWNRFYTKYADKNNVILIFPSANKEYNWMTSNKGFFMVPTIVRQIKKAINIDDNKIFISGHSNGATGSFSYLMKDPSLFAGFYGFNTHPRVFTGGTFIENMKNRSFINFSTDQDYYYPPQANDSISNLCKKIGVDYQDYRYNGFPHWFPEFDESEPAYKIIFNDLNTRVRNPFPKEISWETDDENNGDVDWISSIKLDTLGQKKNWHKRLNFKIKTWLEYNDSDSLIKKDVDKTAFLFPRKSGKIIASFSDNTFHIKTSNIGSFKLFISPEMIDMGKNVKVFVNGKLYHESRIKYNKQFMLESFEKNKDRSQVWVNRIEVKI